MRRRSLADTRALRIMRARCEARGFRVSLRLREALGGSDARAVFAAVESDLAARAPLPAFVQAWFEVTARDGSGAALAELARDLRDALVNNDVAGEVTHG